MPSLYNSREERVQDVVKAYMNERTTIRHSLTFGGQFLPHSESEKELMREERAWALARLAIDKIMRLPHIAINRTSAA
ncbi:hypothetical protein SAMN05192560_0512 [Methylobacillus rhizosphaerae]|uniref:Uncharacterized protein n=1 Tax=Methylobacillus rhizosphaerae TaxID=551994 RepID=A0A238YD97_9PROT|nr:hypothetical protein [Methylobacillus rhizosphaerae]SNR69107.1 hypothetical protein SAMN05192560_0512 [Methylobacillus rhizosphaerae]